MSFWNRFYDLCGERGVTPSKVAKDLGFSNSICTQWKSGRQKPSAEKLMKIAEYFNVSESYLLYGKEKTTETLDVSEMERKILEIYKKLPEDKKEIFNKILSSLE